MRKAYDNESMTKLDLSPENTNRIGWHRGANGVLLLKPAPRTFQDFFKPYLFVFLFFALLLPSCSPGGNNTKKDETGVRLVNGKPFWFFNPNKDGKAGGVGVSGRHVSGRSAQRELAIHRAVNDLARQMNVEVNSVVSSSSTASSSGSASELRSYSIQTVNGQVVKARIVEFWEDRQTDELYVWMLLQ